MKPAPPVIKILIGVPFVDAAARIDDILFVCKTANPLESCWMSGDLQISGKKLGEGEAVFECGAIIRISSISVGACKC